MTARTYESLSDNFDLVINENNFHRIAQRNAETFGNYKHNYIVHILNTNPKEIDVENDLTIKETLLKEKEELKIKLPSKLIEKLIAINYSDITSNEKALLKYLQENEKDETAGEIFKFINHLHQDFETLLEDYSNLEEENPNITEKKDYTQAPEIKYSEYEAKAYSIKKGLRTLCNVIVNEAVEYSKASLSENIGCTENELENLLNKNILSEELNEKLHTRCYRMKLKYKEYEERFLWIAEGKEYEDKDLGIKDYSDIQLPKTEKYVLERDVLLPPIESFEEKETGKREKREKEAPKKSRFQRLINRFK